MDMDNDVESSALEQILGDMDNMESNRVYGDKPMPAEGVSITIDVAPKPKAEEPKPEEMHTEPDADDDMKLPPFLRKIK
jgi:hypothetical protein